jgi:hypothetical protein
MYGEQCTILTPSALYPPKNRTTSTSNDRYVLQVQNPPGCVILELPFQFPDMLRLKVINQTNGGLSAL